MPLRNLRIARFFSGPSDVHGDDAERLPVEIIQNRGDAEERAMTHHRRGIFI